MRRFCPRSEEKMRPAGADFQEFFAGIVQGAISAGAVTPMLYSYAW
jgi:hypothetical protein